MLQGWLRATWMLVAALAAGESRGAEPLSSNEIQLVHFAFASQLGSGIYSVDGRTLQIYRLPFSWRVAQSRDGRPGVRIRLPTTVGLLDFDPGDLVESGLPDRFDTVSFGLGAELDFPLGDHWHLLPYLELGRAWEVGDGGDFDTYTASLHARADYPAGVRTLRLQAGVLWAGVEDLFGQRGDFARFETGVEVRRRLDRTLGGETADVGGYLLVESYFDQPDEPVLLRAPASRLTPLQYELGVTLGTDPQVRLWGIPLPRVGIAWRFGEGLSVYRLVFGAPF